MAANYWIKLYDEILEDPKMGRLSDGAFRLCINLFLLASRQEPRDGRLPDFDDAAWILRLQKDMFMDGWQELERAGIVHVDDGTLIVTRFESRQKALSKAEKQKRYRDRKRTKALQSDDASVTDGVTKGNTDKDKDKDKDKEIDKENTTIGDVTSKNNSGGGDFSKVVTEYENNIGAITPVIGEQIGEAVDEFGGQWVIDAIAIAVKANARSWRYVNGVLRRWRVEGRNDIEKITKVTVSADGGLYV